MLTANIATTMKDTVYTDGRGSLYRFHRSGAEATSAQRAGDSHVPVLLVPPLVNRWYVMDLRKGSSIAAALTNGTPWTTYLYDWGVPEDEDRYESWDDVLATLERVVRQVLKDSGASQVALAGYCMGATLSSIYTALYPTKVAAFVNMLGPVDFAHAGRLGTMVDPRWFDPYAMTAPGNLPAAQMQAGFLALSPTSALTKWLHLAGNLFDRDAIETFGALETWANDNVPFPGGAYVTYIKELYQENRLIHGDHWARGRRVDLSRITCPLLTVVAQRDAICPPRSALALHDVARSETKDVLSVPGGHEGAMVGARARSELYPRVVSFLETHGSKREALPTRVAMLPESRL